VIPPPPPPPPASPTAKTVATAKPTSSAPASTPKARQRNPLRTDAYDSGAPDAVSTGLNIPV
jgi:hypothetical protein